MSIFTNADADLTILFCCRIPFATSVAYRPITDPLNYHLPQFGLGATAYAALSLAFCRRASQVLAKSELRRGKQSACGRSFGQSGN
jgi:hypothetical protein